MGIEYNSIFFKVADWLLKEEDNGSTVLRFEFGLVFCL
jgi:hypothetical protein